ncbi:MAG: gliding motility-associated C-terminal domain-containing protein [Cyclobacteriaceae bacterium]
MSELRAGTYQVTVNNPTTGCSEGPFDMIIEDVSTNPDIVFYLLAEDDYCATGGAEGSGGIKAAVRLENGDTTSVGYTFAWFTDDTYTTALTAGTTVAFSGLNNSRVRGLSDRTYYLRVTDSDGTEGANPDENESLNCFSESFQVVPQAPVDITIEQDVDLIVDDNDDCDPDFDGSFIINQITINGNKVTDLTDYEFTWAAVSGGADVTGKPLTSTNGTNNGISLLPAGIYSVTINNATTGCMEGPLEFEIEDLSVAPEIILYTLSDDENCTMGGSDGTGGFKAAVRLENGDTTSIGFSFTWYRTSDLLTALNTGDGSIVLSGLNESRIAGLSDDNYTVVVVDTDDTEGTNPDENESVNCSSSISRDVVDNPAEINLQVADYAITANVTCDDEITDYLGATQSTTDFTGGIKINFVREDATIVDLTDPMADTYQFDWVIVDGATYGIANGATLPAVLPSGVTIGTTSDVDAIRDQINQLPPGAYRLMVTNTTTTCMLSTPIEINVEDDLTDPTLEFTSTNNMVCDNTSTPFDGALQVRAMTGGDGFIGDNRWQYEWFVGQNTNTPFVDPTNGVGPNQGSIDGMLNDDNLSHIENLATGFYAVRVSDRVTGCVLFGSSRVDEVLDFPFLSVDLDNIDPDYSCNGAGTGTGAISVTADDITIEGSLITDLGQTLNDYSFEWRNASGDVYSETGTPNIYDFGGGGTVWNAAYLPADLDAAQTGLDAGTYFVVATNTLTGCAAPQARADVPNEQFGPLLTVSLTANTTCTGGNGGIEIMAMDLSDPNPIYTFTWTDPMSGAVTSTDDPTGTSSISGQPGGVYTVVVLNTNTGCSTSQQIEIFDEPIDPIITQVDLVAQTICNANGSAEIPASSILYNNSTDVLTDYTIEWRNEAGDIYRDNAGTLEFGAVGTPVTATQITGLTAGNYEVIVTGNRTTDTDATFLANEGCTSEIYKFTIEDNVVLPRIIVEQVAMDQSCNTNGLGELQARVDIGGTLETEITNTDLSFEWFEGTLEVGDVVPGSGFATASSIDSLNAGAYTVYVMNAATGCNNVNTINVESDPIDPIIITTDIVEATSCSPGNGSAEITAMLEGDVADYSFFWFDSEASLDAFNPFFSGVDSIGGLSAGSYFVIAEHNYLGCRSTLPTQIDIADSTSAPVITQVDIILQTNCNPANPNGAMSVAADGVSDTTFYSYRWFNELGEVIEENNPSVSGLAAGLYVVEVTNRETGCVNTEDFPMADDVDNPLDLRVSVSANTNCINPQFGILPNGVAASSIVDAPKSASNYNFYWFSGTTIPASVTDFESASNFIEINQLVDSLAAGDYTVIAIDNEDNFCTSLPVTVVIPDESDNPRIELDQVAPLTNCDPLRPNAEAVASTPSGKISFYSFDWYVGTDTTGVEPFFTGIQADSLTATTYTVVIHDLISGCQNLEQITIEDGTIPVPVPNVADIENRRNCVVPDGSAAVSIDGEVEGYTFNWFAEGDLVNPIFTGVRPSDLDAGVYFITATSDLTGCVSEAATVTIEDISKEPAFIVNTRPSVCSLNNGEADIEFIGERVNIDSIVWDLGGGDLRHDFALSSATDGQGYRVFVRDVFQCTFEATFNIGTDIIVYNGVSDNNDGQNDWFIVDCIDRFPNNNVKIFNRAGTLVWEMDFYDNADVRFEGVANKRLSLGTDRLPEGTYYYLIDRDKDDGSNQDQLQGFLELVR